MEILTFYAITVKSIKVQKHLAPQNDRLNLSFVKDTYANAEKMVIHESQILRLTL